MWKFLPSDCNCNETPTNPNSSVCNHDGLTTDDLVYDGENLSCSGISNQDNISVAFQELDYFICGIELTQHILDLIQNNPQEYSELITIINGAINCETILACGPPPPSTTTTTSSSTSTSTSTTTSTSSSTTTTTTTIALACVNYTIESILNDASWTALNCEGVPVGGIITTSGTSEYTGCVLNTSITLVNAIITDQAACATTTTTTTVLDCSFTGDADEVTTTTTTTTAAPEGCLEYIINPVVGATHTVQYIECGGSLIVDAVIPPEGPGEVICAENPLISDDYPASTTLGGSCLLCRCTYWNTYISMVDIVASDNDLVYITYMECVDGMTTTSRGAGTGQICVDNFGGSTPLLYILVGGTPTAVSESTATYTANCCGIGPTTTTSTTLPGVCTQFNVDIHTACETESGFGVVEYVGCANTFQSILVPVAGLTYNFCALVDPSITPPTIVCGLGDITQLGECPA